MTRRLPSAKGRARRSAVEVVEERTVATTVVFGRWRRVLVSPRPIPVHSKKEGRERIAEHVISKSGSK
jgi:hypothetical protein